MRGTNVHDVRLGKQTVFLSNAMSEQIVVVGSYNFAFFFKGRSLPAKGESILGDVFYEGHGGKGSNQAVCAAGLGGNVRFIGCVGDDVYGQGAKKLYEQVGVQTEHLFVESSSHTGVGAILIDQNGDNMISVVPGSNQLLSTAHIDRAESVIASSRILASQLEGPLDTYLYALQTAKKHGVTTLLDPAPAVPLSEEFYAYTDWITPNETEAEILTGVNVSTLDNAVKAGKILCERGVGAAIMKLGERGCIHVTAETEQYYPAYPVSMVDATGAGDAFAAGFMVALASGKTPEEALKIANVVGALSVTKIGVVNAFPTQEEIERIIS